MDKSLTEIQHKEVTASLELLLLKIKNYIDQEYKYVGICDWVSNSTSVSVHQMVVEM